MYRCIVDFMIDRAGEQFTFASGTLWNAKENEYGSITISNEKNIITISKNIFVNYFEKVEE